MKKIFIIFFIFMASYVIADEIINNEQTDLNKYSISKKEWSEYQKYKKEQEEKVFISEEEYNKYQQYKEQISIEEKNKEKEEKEEKEVPNKTKSGSTEISILIDKTANYKTDSKINGNSISVSKSEGWGATLELGYKDNGIVFGGGININDVDGSTFVNIYPCIKIVVPIENDKTIINFFFGGAVGYGYFSEKYSAEGIEFSGNGTLFWKLSCGFDINNFRFFINDSTNYMNITAYSSYYDTKLSGSATYKKLSFGIGYKFIL